MFNRLLALIILFLFLPIFIIIAIAFIMAVVNAEWRHFSFDFINNYCYYYDDYGC